MPQRKPIALDFVVDKLTNSIENIITGDSFRTEVAVVTAADIKKVAQKNGWLFNWKFEYKHPEREIYKLTIAESEHVIQGLISLEVRQDHVYMHLIESAPFNRGTSKVYAGVPANLLAFACRLSFQRGFSGVVSFLAKTNLIAHYKEALGATHWGGQLMSIETAAALKLINRYFNK